MRKRLRLLALAALLAAGPTIFFVGNWSPRMTCHARARFRLEGKETDYLATFYQDHITVVSNLLNTQGSRSTLAAMSKIEEKSFALTKVGPVRSTRFLYVTYSGQESNAVQSVASNAANLVVSFYATNNPSWEVTFLDSECFRPESPLDRLQNSVESLWEGFKSSLGW
jgi:hypothetical protein